MKKFLSMLLAVTMVLSMLAACNNDVPVEKPDDPGNQEEIQGNEVEDEKLTLVADGLTEYVIVRGENAYISEVTASTELQSYLKKISGVEIPIVTDATAPVEKEIVVGKTNRETDGEFDREELGDDGFVIKTKGEKLFLAGGEQRGTLYAVYEFLESYLGCGFYTARIEKVPEMKTVSIEKIEEDKQIPIMRYRDLSWASYSHSPSIMVKRRLNSSTGGALSAEYGSGIMWSPYVHTFSSIINYSVYGAEHPEYFAHTEDGTLIDNTGRPQLCLTNPEVLQITIDTVKSWIESNPDVDIVSVSQNDGGGPCMCSECKKVYAEENGAYSGTNIRFVNAVADAIKDEYPDVMIETLAYQYSREACVTKPKDNVIVRLCTIECCFIHSLQECSAQPFKPADSYVSANSFAEDFSAWSQLCDNIYVWDYTTNFWLFTVNFSTFETLRENMLFFAENNVKGVFEQGDGFTQCGEFNDLRCYLISKLLWDPYMSEDEYYGYMDEFLEYVYGPGGTYIREFIDYREEYLMDYHAGCKVRDDDDKEVNLFDIYGIDIQAEVRDDSVVPEDITLDMILNYETTDFSAYYDYYDTIPVPEIIRIGYDSFTKAMELAENDVQRTEIDKALIQVEILDSHHRYALIDIQRANVGNAVKNRMSSLEDFPKEDINRYFSKISVFYNIKLTNEYALFNQALGEKMISYGITTVKECWDADAYFHQDANYKKMPRGW